MKVTVAVRIKTVPVVYTSEQVLDMIMELDPEPMERDFLTSDWYIDTADEDEEYLPGAGSSFTSSTDSFDGREGETLLALSWRSKNEEIHWAPTNSLTLQLNPPSTGKWISWLRSRKSGICCPAPSDVHFSCGQATSPIPEMLRFPAIHAHEASQVWLKNVGHL